MCALLHRKPLQMCTGFKFYTRPGYENKSNFTLNVFVYVLLFLHDFSRLLFMCNGCYFANKIITYLQCDSYVYFYTKAHLIIRLRYIKWVYLSDKLLYTPQIVDAVSVSSV